jgi:drug/metabolite transporter (DMT)-like permease
MFLGELSALSAALLWSFSSFVFTNATMRIGTTLLNISRLVLASIFLVITFLIAGIAFTANTSQILWLALSGFIGLVIGDTFLFMGFREIGPRITMLIMSTNPAIASVIAYFVFGETISLYGIIGIFVTLGGVSLVVLSTEEKEHKKFKITKIGIFYGLMGAIGQGVGLIFAKLANDSGQVHSLIATFIRILASVIILLPIALFTKKLPNPIKVFRKDKIALWLVVLGSIIGPYLGITFSFIAITYTKVGIASTIMSSVPIFMLPLSHFFYKEKLTWRAIAGAFIAVAGVAMLFMV